MRILWIGKQSAAGDAGDEIFDSKTISAFRELGHSVDLFHPRRVGSLKEGINLIRGIPHQRTRYASADNLKRMRAASVGYDMVISSWEPFDWLALQLDVPLMLILHNITSRSLPALFPNSLLVSYLAKRVHNWERRHYAGERKPRAIGVLSRRDQSFVQSLKACPEVVYLPPGMPPLVELRPDAVLLQELTLMGTFDWVPKRRDVIAFAQDYAAAGSSVVVRAHRLPPEADVLLKPLPAPTPVEAASALRFGIITDRFESGHKFKTSAYIASNNIVLSFSDVSFDFEHIPDHDLFIRRVHSFAEMQDSMEEIAAMSPVTLRDRFVEFKQRCGEWFTWSRVAERLVDTAAHHKESGRSEIT